VLPEVVAAVGGRTEVLFDGGIRRGSDIVKALFYFFGSGFWAASSVTDLSDSATLENVDSCFANRLAIDMHVIR
jgi:hypothetical protein